MKRWEGFFDIISNLPTGNYAVNAAIEVLENRDIIVQSLEVEPRPSRRRAGEKRELVGRKK